MEFTFIYYKNLRFDDKKKFSIDFSNEDLLEGVVFKKNKDYYITSMACYVDFNIDITAQQNYTKIKQTSDLATTILRCDVDVGYGRKYLTLYFVLTNLEEVNTLKTLNFLMLKIKN